LFFAYRNVLIVAVHVLFHILSFNIFSPVAEHEIKNSDYELKIKKTTKQVNNFLRQG